MGRYITKRELPFVKKGELVRVEVGKYYCLEENNRDKKHWVALSDDEFNYLLSEGWIEEVKPREFYLALHDNSGFPVFAYEEIPNYPDKSGLKLVKVREVLDV